MPQEKPPPLGHRVPDVNHAISVQLPTWQDMCGMAFGDTRVKQVQRSGYPRSFLHQDVEKVLVYDIFDSLILLTSFELAHICVMDYLNISDNNSCLLFPNLDSAKACQNFLLSSAPEHGLVETQVASLHGFRLAKTLKTVKKGALLPEIYAVTFSRTFFNTAMIFWRLTGTGVSSRCAAYWLENTNNLTVLGSREANHSSCQESWTASHQIICERIVDLLQRASIESSRAVRLSTHDVFLYQTGMSAVYHVHQLLLERRGTQSIVFGFPYELTLKMLQTYGPGCVFYPFGSDEEVDLLDKFLGEQTSRASVPQALWCECPSNPLLRTPNLQKLRSLADHHGFVLVVDDTIGSFANVDLLGTADIVITSLTKSFSGYSNVMAGR